MKKRFQDVNKNAFGRDLKAIAEKHGVKNILFAGTDAENKGISYIEFESVTNALVCMAMLTQSVPELQVYFYQVMLQTYLGAVSDVMSSKSDHGDSDLSEFIAKGRMPS